MVSEVKDQGQCGSCYAFSAIGALESAFIRLRNSDDQHLRFSEQEIVDCSQEYGNQGCNGGMLTNVYDYIQVHNISLESQYPYVATQGECILPDAKGYSINGYQTISQSDQKPEDLLNLLSENPVAVAIEVQ